MNGFLQGLLGGLVPSALMIIVYFISLAGRLAKIETNIEWLIKEQKGCLPPSKDPTP